MIKLNKPYTPLGKPSRHQTVRRIKFPASSNPDRITLNVLAGSFERSVNSGTETLHPVRHLILRNARTDFRIAIILFRNMIQLTQRVQHGPPRVRVNPIRIRQKQNWIARCP